MIFLKLHQLAEEFSTDQSQRAFLDSIVFEDERSFSRLLHENTAHEMLLGGDFGACCLALLGLSGTCNMWMTLKDFGYGGQSALYSPNPPHQPPNSQIAGLAQMTVWGGVLSLGGIERIKQFRQWLGVDLWDTRVFANGGGSVGSVGFGVMHGDNEVFLWLMDEFKTKLENDKQASSYVFYEGRVPAYIGKMIEYCSVEALHKDNTQTLLQRLEKIFDAFCEAMYGKTPRWKDMVERLPSFGMGGTQAYLEYGLSRTPEQERWTHNHILLLGQLKKWTGFASLCQKAPIEHVTQAGEHLLACIEKEKFYLCSEHFMAWASFMNRLKQDKPMVFEAIPVAYRKGQFLDKASKEEIQRATLWCETFSFNKTKPVVASKKM